MREWSVNQGVAVWAYCLMPDHVHLIAVLEAESGLTRAIRERTDATRGVYFREGWPGYLEQGRTAVGKVIVQHQRVLRQAIPVS